MDAFPSRSGEENQQQRQHPYDIDHIKLDDAEYMSEVPAHLQNQQIPGFPTTILSVGGPGSGKTNVMLNLITRKDFWFKFFDKIYLLGPTIKSDKLWKKIKVADDQIVTDPGDFITKLSEWTKQQIQAVESDPSAAPKCLFIFEDITSYATTVQNDPEFAKCFNAIRHHKATAYANVHKYKAFNRTARMCCMHIMAWKINNTEIRQLFEDYGPSNLTYHDFELMCQHIWMPDARNKKPFLYINKYIDDENQRYRRGFSEIIDLKAYEGRGRREKKRRKLQDDKLVKGIGKKRKAGDASLEEKNNQPPNGVVENPEKRMKENDTNSNNNNNSKEQSESYSVADSRYKVMNSFAYLR